MKIFYLLVRQHEGLEVVVSYAIEDFCGIFKFLIRIC